MTKENLSFSLLVALLVGLLSFAMIRGLDFAPRGTRVGDEIWIFVGAATPFIIRRIDGGAYKFIGNGYVHGIMKGELMEDLEKGRYELRQVAIR
jgi:hypothetical protein